MHVTILLAQAQSPATPFRPSHPSRLAFHATKVAVICACLFSCLYLIPQTLAPLWFICLLAPRCPRKASKESIFSSSFLGSCESSPTAHLAGATVPSTRRVQRSPLHGQFSRSSAVFLLQFWGIHDTLSTVFWNRSPEGRSYATTEDFERSNLSPGSDLDWSKALHLSSGPALRTFRAPGKRLWTVEAFDEVVCLV